MNRIVFALSHPLLGLRWIFHRGSALTNIELSLIERHLEGLGIIIEAGASDGVDTLRIAEYFPLHRVIAIEPIKEQFDVMKNAVQHLENVRPEHFALNTISGVAEMYVGSSGSGIGGMGSSSLLEPEKHVAYFPEIQFGMRQKVNAMSIEDYCSKNDISKIDLFWLDLQGYEMSIIRKSANFFVENVNLIHMEVSRVQLYKGAATYDEILSEMKALGFIAVKKRVGRVSGNCLFKNQNLKRI
jgi:FkbM family methyltransferase